MGSDTRQACCTQQLTGIRVHGSDGYRRLFVAKYNHVVHPVRMVEPLNTPDLGLERVHVT